ncbi:hypothetical protein JCM6977_39980 [Salmonella enterica subsp. enterica]
MKFLVVALIVMSLAPLFADEISIRSPKMSVKHKYVLQTYNKIKFLNCIDNKYVLDTKKEP